MNESAVRRGRSVDARPWPVLASMTISPHISEGFTMFANAQFTSRCAAMGTSVRLVLAVAVAISACAPIEVIKPDNNSAVVETDDDSYITHVDGRAHFASRASKFKVAPGNHSLTIAFEIFGEPDYNGKWRKTTSEAPVTVLFRAEAGRVYLTQPVRFPEREKWMPVIVDKSTGSRVSRLAPTFDR